MQIFVSNLANRLKNFHSADLSKTRLKIFQILLGWLKKNCKNSAEKAKF